MASWGAENEVIGSILVDSKTMDEVVRVLVAEDFQSVRHRFIYRAILRLYERNQPINIVSLTELLEKQGNLENAGGVAYLTELVGNVATTSHLDYFVKIVKEKSTRSKLIQATEEIRRAVERADYEDIDDLISQSEEIISQVRTNLNTKGLTPISERIMKHIQRLEEAKMKDGIKGHSWGFDTVNKMTSGLCDGQLIIIAARPGVGKTTMLLHLAKELAVNNGLPVGFFALEMTEEELVDKLLSSLTGVPHTLINNGKVKNHWGPLTDGFAALDRCRLEIDDTPAVTINYIAAEARKMKRKYGRIGAIMIDYLQLIEPSEYRRGQTRDQEIGLITRRAKQLAKELECPVIMACQLNRDVEKRNIKKPVLADLRESGNIEQDANIVCFLHPEEDGEKTVRGEPISQINFIIAKNRAGMLGSVPLLFRRAYQSFIEAKGKGHQS